MDAPIGVIEIHLQLEIAAPVKVPPGTAAPSPHLLRHCEIISKSGAKIKMLKFRRLPYSYGALLQKLHLIIHSFHSF